METTEKKKIMVIGGLGYVGTRLSNELFRLGHDITVVDTAWFGNHLNPQIPIEKIRIMNAVNLVVDDFVGFDQVIWIAGLSNDAQANFSPWRNFKENAALPVYIAYMAKAAGVKRFINAGSCSSLGYSPNEEHDDSSIVAAQFPYGNAKGMSEAGLRPMIDDHFSVISFRKGTISGPSHRMRFDLIGNAMYKDAVVKREITVNNPDIWRPILDMTDAVSGYVKAIEAHPKISGILNLISENTTVLDVAMRIKTRMEWYGYPQIKLNILNIPDVRNYRAKHRAAKYLIRYEPHGSIETIVDELHAYRDQYGDFNNPNYYNIEIFKKIGGEES